MQTPLPKATFYTMAARWTKIISLPGENAIEVWAPLESPDIRIRQLQADEGLQKELFPKEVPYLIEINAKELDIFTFSDFEKQIGYILHNDSPETFNLESWLAKEKKRKLLNK